MIATFYREILSDPVEITAVAEKVVSELGTATHRLVSFTPGATPRVRIYQASGDRMLSLLVGRGAEFGITEGLALADQKVDVPTTLLGYGFPNGRTRHNSGSAPNLQLRQKYDGGNEVVPQQFARGLKVVNRSAMKSGVDAKNFTASEIVGQRQFEGIRLIQYPNQIPNDLTLERIKEATSGVTSPQLVLGRMKFDITEEEEPGLYGL